MCKEKKEFEGKLVDESRAKENAKQIVDNEKSLKLLKEELLSLQNDIHEKKEKIIEEDSKSMQIDKLQGELDQQLQGIQSKFNSLEDEVTSLCKTIAVTNAQHHSHITTRMQLEIDIRESNEAYRHENASSLLHRKQFERMKRLFLKKKNIVEKTKELIEQMKNHIQENTMSIKIQEKENDEQTQAIDEMKDIINVKITRFMEQQSTEEGMKEDFELISNAVEGEESEVDNWRTEVKKLYKIGSILTLQHETQIRKTRNILCNEKETLEMVKLKNIVIMDIKKVLYETNKRAKEFGALFEVLKNERNEIEDATTATTLALIEIRKKLNENQEELQNLNLSQEVKKYVLTKEKDAHESSKSNRAILRSEKTKLRAEYRQKREIAERIFLQVSKLKSTLSCLQKEILRLQNRNERLEGGKRNMAEQLEDKKVEIYKLLQRANAYEETLKKGELSIEQKREDIRAIKLECANIERYIAAKRILKNEIETYDEKIFLLERELGIQMNQGKEFSSQLEDPMSCERWVPLDGEDLDEEHLDAKIKVLSQRLNESKEHAMEKEVLLEEIKKENVELQRNLKIASEETQPVVKNLNDSQTRVREVTRCMMALVSELSMYQAIALKLQEEKECQEESLGISRDLIKNGKAPSDDALRDLRRLLRQRKLDDSVYENSTPTSIQEDDLGHVYYSAAYALRTTAEPRPTAYIPDSGIEVPKPYGAMAPFKPNGCGSTMRRIHSHQT
mmetsp:Transcript_15035/g.17162  ORF Transcript_15035/g.17162 Transcript_15035/m.17162 type:complete len:734 (+) Transcript_15035:216-2417(+)